MSNNRRLITHREEKEEEAIWQLEQVIETFRRIENDNN